MIAIGEREIVALVGHGDKTAEVEALAREPGAAFVPEGRPVFPSLSVDENLTLGAFRDRRDKPLVETRRAQMLERFPRLAERRAQPAGTLSSGEQQLLVIARALMAAPRLLVLDELSAGLGPQAIALVAAALADPRLGVAYLTGARAGPAPPAPRRPGSSPPR